MQLSARNQIKGTVVNVQRGPTTAHVRIDIGAGVVITASITNEAVDELALAVGDDAIAVVKASDVMVANCQCHDGNRSAVSPPSLARPAAQFSAKSR